MKHKWIAVLPVLLLAAALGLFLAMPKEELLPETASVGEAQALLDALSPEFGLYPPKTEDGKALAETWYGAMELKAQDAETVLVKTPSFSALVPVLGELMQEELHTRLLEARRGDEIYTDTLSVRPELLEEFFSESLAKLLGTELPAEERVFPLRCRRLQSGAWRLEDWAELRNTAYGTDFDTFAALLRDEAAATLRYERKSYSLPRYAHEGETPDPSCILETEDPAEVAALLQTPLAQQLIGDRALVFNENLDFIPGTLIHVYLDESILALVWLEKYDNSVLTFAEVFPSDPSQLGRKLVGDDFEFDKFVLISELAKETRGVVAISGDFYDFPLPLKKGIQVFEGQVYRFENIRTESCFVTEDGELLFGRCGQFTGLHEAQDFVTQNRVSFSLCFGPAVIENGEDITPQYYKHGEIYDEYSRCLFGTLEKGHYLGMTVNSGAYGCHHTTTLFTAVEIFRARGVQQAYTLDGGQTASILFNGELINPVQIGERKVSDLIFFGTAVPAKD